MEMSSLARMEEPAKPVAPDRKEFLDVARGGATLLVLFDHGLATCSPAYREWCRTHSNFQYPFGQIGVFIFFMVSGFVVPMSLEKGGTLAGFWQRRIFRLFPVYWVSLAVAFIFVLAGGRGMEVRLTDVPTWLANSLMIQTYLHRPHVWGVYWTLPIEIIIYVACSCLFVSGLLRRISSRACLGTVVFLTLVAIGQSLFGNIPGQMDGLRQAVFFSCLFGLLASRHVGGHASHKDVRNCLLGLGMALLIVWGVNCALFPVLSPSEKLGRLLCIWVPAYGFFFALVALRHRQMPKALCWLGRRSYPIYLLHPFVLLVLPAIASPWVFMTSLLAFTVAIAALAHRFVELPGIALGRWLETRAKHPRVATPEPVLHPAPSGLTLLTVLFRLSIPRASYRRLPGRSILRQRVGIAVSGGPLPGGRRP